MILRPSSWILSLAVGVAPMPSLLAQKPPIPEPLPKKETLVPPPAPPNSILKKGETPIDLATALNLAGLKNPEILLARERITEAAAIKRFAAAQALPSLNVGSNFNLHRGALQQANGNILKVDRDALYVGLGAGAVGAGTVNIPGLSYNLNVGTAWFNFLQSKQLVKRNTAAARTVENDTLLRVCLAYTDLLRADARLAIAGQNRTEAAELVRITEAYAKAGQGRKADADRATVELRKRDAELTQAEGDTLTASAKLGRLLSLESTLRLRPLDGWAVPAPIVPDPVPVAELVAIALMQRPELEERRAEIQASLYALSNAKLLPFSPNVVLGFSTGQFGGNSNLVSTPNNLDNRVDFDAAIYFTLQNLGVGNIAINKSAASRVRQSNFRQQETLNKVRAEVVEADARSQARFAQIDAASKAVESSRQAFDEDHARIKGREGLPIETIDSLRLLSRSRYEYLDAIIEYNRAQFQLYVAMGQPPAATLARPVPPSLVKPTVEKAPLPKLPMPEKQ